MAGMAKKKQAKTTDEARPRPPSVILTTHQVPEIVVLTLPRDEAMALSDAIDGALARAQRSLNPMLSADVRLLQRATYALLGMPIPDWLDEQYY